MKILSIRLENLASFDGAFELALEHGPLAGVGLFAITGATGSGKSTLLDALCLALFNEIPRLTGSGAADIGVEAHDRALWIKSNDVRSILRRGKAEGRAEVEFIGNDGRRYRAGWLVRRARNRPTGKLQPEEMTLEDLETGQILASRKTEVLRRIESVIGLNFEQFRRSVLLAQGDFAAFLKAKSEERSELLERITGTEIYGNLSVAAHRRATEEKQRLTAIEQQLAGSAPLAAEARADLEAHWQAARQDQERLTAECEGIRAAMIWHATHGDLAAEVDLAGQTVVETQQAVEAAGDRRQRQQQRKRARHLAGLLTAFEAAAEALAGSQREAGLAGEAQARARETQQAAGRALAGALARVEAAQQQAEAAQPVLHEARRLDDRLSVLDAQMREARTALVRETAECQAAEADQERRATALVGLEGALADLAGWREQESWRADLADQWPRWSTDFAACQTAAGEAAGAGKALAAALSGLDQRELERIAASGKVVEYEAALRLLEEEVAGLDQQLGADPLQELHRARADAEERLEGLQRLAGQAEGYLADAAQHEALRGQQQTLSAQMAASAVELAALRERRQAAEGGLAEARRSVDGIRQAVSRDVTALRSQLQAGTPCLVCGATDHPWQDNDPRLAQLLAEGVARLAALETAVGEIVQAGSELEAHCSLWRDQLQAQAATAAALAQRLADQAARWPEAAAGAGCGFPPETAGAWLTTEIAALGELLTALRVRERTAIAAALQLQDAQQRRSTTHTALVGALAAQETALRAVQSLREEAALARQARDHAERAGDAAATRLEPVLAHLPEGWPRLQEEPARLQQACAAAVREWQEREAELVRLQAEKQAHLTALAGLGAALEGCRRGVAARRAALEQLEAQRQSLHAARRGLLDGQPVAAAEAALEAVGAAVTKALDAAQSAAGEAGRALAAAQERGAAAASALARAEKEAAMAEAALSASLRENELTLDVLRCCLAVTREESEAEDEALAALVAACGEARALLAERQRRLDAHLAANPSRLPAAEAAAACEAANTRLEEAARVAAGYHARILADDGSRSRCAAFTAEHAAQHARWTVWQSLNELIGSYDGKTFRKYAQSLTLSVLLHAANGHLADLSRRYRLLRAPGSDLEMMVLDREMGDEVRSVHSLSGGESFLVSLSLALGLASLSSRQTQVDSLFIDEGFGTLDPDTLETALTSLEALQAQGRKVGVISHMEALVGRIAAQVRVETLGGGRSRLRVASAGTP